MLELGQLDEYHAEFAKRGVRVVAASLEGLEDSRSLQARFPHLVIVSDADRGLADAAAVIHRDSNPQGGDTTAPTTLLVDGAGTVLWTFRPDRVLTRLSPAEVLAAVDQHLPTARR